MLAWVGVFVAGFLFYGVVQIISLASLQITEIKVNGTKMLDEEDVAQKIKKEISGNYYWFFPKTNVVLYPKNTIQSDVLALFPAISSVTLSIGSSRELLVNITEREPVAIWCGREKPMDGVSSNSGCFYVDKTGYLFAASPRFSGDAYFTLYGGSGVRTGKNIGQYLTTSDIFQKVMNLRKFIFVYRVSVDNIFLGENNYAEFFNDEDFTIKWNTDENIDALKSNMQAIFRSSNWKDGTFSSNPEQSAKPLEYLDFRFGNKIFYKQKGEAQIPAENGTTTTT